MRRDSDQRIGKCEPVRPTGQRNPRAFRTSEAYFARWFISGFSHRRRGRISLKPTELEIGSARIRRPAFSPLLWHDLVEWARPTRAIGRRMSSLNY